MGRDDGRDAGSAASGSEFDRAISEAILHAIGGEGYRLASVGDLAAAAGLSQASFEERFGGKEGAFLAAYELVAEGLRESALAACRAAETKTWMQAFPRALQVVLDFVAAEPEIARSLIIEVRAAGEPAVALHERMVERLSRAVDSARRHPASRHSAPPSTAGLMIGAIEGALRSLLVSDDAAQAPQLIGDLTYLVVLSYFDEDTAFAAMEEARRDA
jgi:AcrR family transcriptional regulator